MNLEKIIAIRNAKTIYKDDDNCVKVFNVEYSKADILNEALPESLTGSQAFKKAMQEIQEASNKS